MVTAAAQRMRDSTVCAACNTGFLAAAQLRCGEVRSGLDTTEEVIQRAQRLRSVSVRAAFAPLQQAAAARRDSACQEMARALERPRAA